MYINMAAESPFGVTADHWYPLGIDSRQEGKLTITLGLFASAEARVAGRDPLMTRCEVLPGELVTDETLAPFLLAVLALPGYEGAALEAG